MTTKLYQLLTVLLVTLLTFSITADASMLIPANDKAKENSQAPEHSPVITDGWGVERIDFIHYARPESPAKPSKSTTCYKLMGVKWAGLPVSYTINPTNSEGLSESFVAGKILTSAETWDASTSKELFNNAYTVDYGAQYGVYDYKNSIVFAPYDPGAIAVTSVWYIPATRQIIEFDMLFNDYYAWGDAAVNPYLMDFQNIATHELGHSVGMDDIYTESCSAVTMFGYGTEGETQKSTLAQPDITGLRKMYGN